MGETGYTVPVPDWFDTSWNNNTSGSASDVGSTSQSGAPGGDPWGGFFRDAAQSLLGYAINRDAAANGIQTPQANPTYIQTPSQQQANLMPVILIVGAVVAVVALNK